MGLGEALRLLDPCSFGEVTQPLRLLLGLAPLPLVLAVAAGRARVLAAVLSLALLALALVPRPGPGGVVDCYFDTSAFAPTTPLAWSALMTLNGLAALLGLGLRKWR